MDRERRDQAASTAADLSPEHQRELMGEAVREGPNLFLRDVRHRCALARRGLLVDRMYSTQLTPLGEAVREHLLTPKKD